MTTTVPACPSHLELCLSVQILQKMLYQLYRSATPSVFLWSAKVHIEWKLINLHFSMTGQTYLRILLFEHLLYVLNPFFASLATGL